MLTLSQENIALSTKNKVDEISSTLFPTPRRCEKKKWKYDAK
jgi:hypothetical protein